MISPKPAPTYLPLDGDGPIETDIVESVELALGEVMAVLEIKTVMGKVVMLPMGHQAVIDLHEMSGQVVLAEIGRQAGGTVQ